MKSDIEKIIESQTWKRSNTRLAFRQPPKIRTCRENTDGFIDRKKTFSDVPRTPVSEFSSLFTVKHASHGSSNFVAPVQIPLFPKLPFGQHSKAVNNRPLFKREVWIQRA